MRVPQNLAGAASLLALLALLASGCGRLRFEPRALTEGDASMDGSMDAAARSDAATPQDSGAVDASEPVDANERDAGEILPPCDESPCRLVSPQCGCGMGLACQRPFGDDPRRACQAPGPVLGGQACRGNSECTTAHVCVAGGASTSGVCEPYCASNADCDPGSFCRELVVRSEDIGSCATMCDPVASTGCPASLGCGVAYTRNVPDRSFAYSPVCTESGPATGEPCPEFFCAPGNTCMGTTCRRVCDRASPDCGGCTAFSPALVVAGRELGYCP